VAPNPPFGAVFTYYLSDGLKTAKEQRREDEKKREEQQEDTSYPGWDALREEEVEESPAMVLTVSNASGEVIRRIEGPVSAGFHRVAWDLRYPLSAPWTADTEGEKYMPVSGPLAPPGSYHVSLARRVNGELFDLDMNSTFEVKSIIDRGLPGAPAEEVAAFALRLDTLNRQVKGAGAAVAELLVETQAVKDTLLRSSAAPALRDQVRSIELQLLALQQTLQGNEARSLYGDAGPVSISSRLNAAVMGTFRSSYGPTATHSQAVEIAEAEFAGVESSLGRIVDIEMPALRKELDKAGVPWTPGRGVPGRD
jgi:hypothetical protein